MEVLCVIALLFVAYWLNKGYGWIKFKNKYPILSSQPPAGILEVGDIVVFGEYRKEFRGMNRTDGLWYVFMPDDRIDMECIEKSEAIAKMDAIYGVYGLKWKRIS